MLCICTSKKDSFQPWMFLPHMTHGKLQGWSDVHVFYTHSNRLHACIQDSLGMAYLCMYTQVFCPAFYVIYDHQEKAIVVAIRGSMTVQVGKNYVLSYINLHHNARVKVTPTAVPIIPDFCSCSQMKLGLVCYTTPVFMPILMPAQGIFNSFPPIRNCLEKHKSIYNNSPYEFLCISLP